MDVEREILGLKNQVDRMNEVIDLQSATIIRLTAQVAGRDEQLQKLAGLHVKMEQAVKEMERATLEAVKGFASGLTTALLSRDPAQRGKAADLILNNFVREHLRKGE